MPSTPNTSAVSYLPVGELLKRVDWRTIADFVSDAGTRGAQSTLATDPNVAALLLDASGMVESACLAGNRYLPVDLAALTGAGQAYLFRLIADVFVGLMIRRRPDKALPVPVCYEDAMQQIEKLRGGDRIFSFQESMDAGGVHHEVESAQVVEDRDLLTLQADRFFGRRADRSNF